MAACRQEGVKIEISHDKTPDMGFSANRLLAILQKLPPCRCYRVAYSGGLDSHVLLHALAQLRTEFPAAALTAIHVDHGLNPGSEQWSWHCDKVCSALGVACEVVKVNARPAKGESPEAAAREARYGALRARIGTDECLLMGQHQDDQAETVLLQLLRGSGVPGLAAMAGTMAFGRGRLLRPLLSFPRVELQAYAEREGLAWIEDPSNFDSGFDRNYLRHEVLPVLRRRWPGVTRTLARVAAHQADAAGLLDKQAQAELAGIRGDGCWLSVRMLAELAPPERRNVLRYWFKQQGFPVPDSIHLQRILDEVLPAFEDSQPLVAWSGMEVRRYRDRLYALKPLPPHDPALVLAWDGSNSLELPPGVGGLLTSRPTQEWGLEARQWRQGPVTVRFRRGGESLHLIGRRHHCTLKKLFQEQGIPPWQRSRIPLIYVGDKLAFVVGIGVDKGFAAQSGVVIEWSP